MHTLGFRFKPWREAAAIADGGAILRYLRETAGEKGIAGRIRYRHRVIAADWSGAEAAWTLTVERDGEALTYRCGFLYVCAGYYDYDRGHAPDFPGAARFGGQIVHPQFWPDGLETAGKSIVVIGSGATAVTLVPELAKTARHVTMLQRSPTYIVARPSRDVIANTLRRVLPERTAYRLTRWKNVLLGQVFYRQMRKHPQVAKAKLIGWVRKRLGDGHDVERHFTPTYDPWDQRLCLVPDGDLFEAIRGGRASVVTDTIETFTEAGIRLSSGADVPADIIVTATGLRLKMLGGMAVTVDGRPADPARSMAYKGMMFSDIPNLAIAFGYTNASWTLKADLTSAYVCRLLRHMAAIGARQATPRVGAPVEREPFLDFISGYVQRARDILPQQGTRAPWRLDQNYLKDVRTLRYGPIDDEMEFR